MNGVAWYIRNGTIKQTGNESQSWARARCRLSCQPMTVTSPQSREVMQQATSSLWQDASWRGVLLEASEVWGIQGLSGEVGGHAGDRQDRAAAAVGCGSGAAGAPEELAGFLGRHGEWRARGAPGQAAG